MAKEGIITTSGLNCYGGRVLTSGDARVAR